MKVLKFIVELIWTLSLQNLFLYMKMLWIWLWSKTEVDEKAAAALKEAKRRTINVVKESKDVIDAAKGKKFKK